MTFDRGAVEGALYDAGFVAGPWPGTLDHVRHRCEANVNHSAAYVRSWGHPAVPADARLVVAVNDPGDVPAAVAAASCVSAAADLHAAVLSGGADVALAVAVRADAPPSVLEVLACHPHPLVRRRVIVNPSATEAVRAVAALGL